MPLNVPGTYIFLEFYLRIERWESFIIKLGLKKKKFRGKIKKEKVDTLKEKMSNDINKELTKIGE